MKHTARINAAFLATAATPAIIKTKLKRYKKDALNYYQPDYTKPKNPEEGC